LKKARPDADVGHNEMTDNIAAVIHNCLFIKYPSPQGIDQRNGDGVNI
jgi:hypothetical protein